MTITYAVECMECNSRAEHSTMAEALALEFERCQWCDHDVGQAVELEPCPVGLTAEDRQPGVGFVSGPGCDDDEHEPRSGLHVRAVEA